MYDFFPKERDAALNAIQDRAEADRRMCDTLAPQARSENKTCVMVDRPLDGWKIVQRMERQEAFLEALPAIVGVLVSLIVLYRLWLKFGTIAKSTFVVAAHFTGKHFSNPIRLLQWILAFVGTTTAVVLWKLL